MKKSKINLEDLLDKMDSVFKILNNIETLEAADINLLKKEANKIRKSSKV